MLTWIKIIGVIPIAMAVYLWPLFAFLAYMMLETPGNNWNGIAYVLLASLVAHYPLAIVAGRKLHYAGPFAQRPEKVRAVAPLVINMMLFTGIVLYLAAVCAWRFSCRMY